MTAIESKSSLNKQPNMEEKSDKAASQSSPYDIDNKCDTDQSVEEEVSSTIKIEEIYRQAWSKKILIVAYLCVIFYSFIETFAGDSTSGLDSYATSSFKAHSMISTAGVVFKIAAIVAYPLVAKASEFLGMSESFAFACTIYFLTYMLYASCQNVNGYFGAEVLFAISKVSYRMFLQIFVANTTSLINRGFWSQLPDGLGAIPSMYVGSIIQDAVIDHSTWRWGYGYWSIIMAVAMIPLVVVMYILDTKTKVAKGAKIKKAFSHLPEGPLYRKILHFVFIDLDFVGMALLVTGLCMFFVPLSMTGSSSWYRWLEPKLIALVVVGGVIFCVFLLWNIRFAKKPFIAKLTVTNHTFLLACAMVAMDFCANAAFTVYLSTSLQTSAYVSVGEASRIINTKKVCFSLFAIVTGLAMKFVKRAKPFVMLGVPMLILGHGLLAHFMNTKGGTSKTVLMFMANVFVGGGRGIYQTALQVTVQALAGIEGVPMSTAFFLAFTATGSLIGTCIAGGIWNNIALSKLKEYLPDETKAIATKIFKSLVVALSYKEGTETRDAIARAYRETEQLIGFIGIGIIGSMAILMFFIQNVKLTKHVDVFAESSEESASEAELKAGKPQEEVKFWSWKKFVSTFH